jgi:hypothetical protein
MYIYTLAFCERDKGLDKIKETFLEIPKILLTWFQALTLITEIDRRRRQGKNLN